MRHYLISIIGIILSINVSYSQNVKSIFKDIEKEKYVEAIEKVNTLRNDNSLSIFEKTLLNISDLLLKNTPTIAYYNPYDAISIFGIIKYTTNEDVLKFLLKNEITFTVLESDIFENILKYSKERSRGCSNS